jgi:hypothetical protein
MIPNPSKEVEIAKLMTLRPFKLPLHVVNLRIDIEYLLCIYTYIQAEASIVLLFSRLLQIDYLFRIK